MPKVVIVDDHTQRRARTAAALLVHGFEVSEVASHEADMATERSRPELMLVELMLEGTNGFELARSLRRSAPSVRVVLTSEYHFTEKQLARLDCGAVGFVPQPFAVPELVDFLRSKLDEPAKPAA
jgi:two-component system OmpR family response regulator